MNSLDQYVEKFIALSIEYLPKLALAILVLFLGLKVIKIIVNKVKKIMIDKETDPSLIPFLSGILDVGLKAILVVSVIQMVGIATTSFVAIIGSAGLAIGLALSGTLQNFAGGVIILILKPYQVGDVIEAQGYIGSVTAIQIFHTILKTWDNKVVIIPNGPLSTGSLVNYNQEPTRSVEWIFGIGYEDDIDLAKQVIQDTIFSDPRVLDTKEDGYFIHLSAMADSSVNLKVRAKVKTPDYWKVFFDGNENIKKAFDAQGITIPYPQRDVHMIPQK